MPRAPGPTENEVQLAILRFLAYTLPPDVFVTSINPIPGKTAAAAGLSKSLGMVAGVPDLLIVHEGRALFIEVKKPGGRLSEAQGRVHTRLWEAGAPVAVCHSVDEVARVVTDWGLLRRGKVKPGTPPADWPARAVA